MITCAIVSNNSLLLNSNYGYFIDNHDIVIRVNSGITLGYEKYVGCKTSIRFCNRILTNCIKFNINSNQYFNNLYIDQIKKDIIYTTFIYSYDKNFSNIFSLPHNVFSYMKDIIDNTNVSSGLISIIYGILNYSTINIFGFTGNRDNKNYHYFNNIKINNYTEKYNYQYEQEIINRLIKNQKINLYN